MTGLISLRINYFVETILHAQQAAEQEIHFTLKKAKFYQRHGADLNDRQCKALERMFQAGPSGFTGGMSAKKYIAITKTSKTTATRDLQNLLEMGALKASGEGRNTHYELELSGEHPGFLD